MLFYKIKLLDTVNQNNTSYLLILTLDGNQNSPSDVCINRALHDLYMTVRHIYLWCHSSPYRCEEKVKVLLGQMHECEPELRIYLNQSSFQHFLTAGHQISRDTHWHSLPKSLSDMQLTWHSTKTRRLVRFSLAWEANSGLLGEHCLCDPQPWTPPLFRPSAWSRWWPSKSPLFETSSKTKKRP